jgi:tetratricopeptide (TPR) repeat protein
MRVFVLLSLVLSLALAAAPKTHRDLRAEGDAAYQRKDYAAAHDAYTAALALQPDSPRYLHKLAAICTLAGNKKEALETLRRLTSLGVVTAVANDPDFSGLRGTPEFADILRALEANRVPRGTTDSIAELTAQTGIIEGLAWRERTGDLFLGDVHQRCIWRRDRAGMVTRFTVEDEELLGVFGLAIDEKRGALWAATSALPEMSGFTAAHKGQAALAEFDLATGDLRRVLAVPADGRDHVLGDLLLAPDGTLYLTDSTAPVVWQFAPGDDVLTKLV